jgi:hypothetical protein
MGKIIPLFKIQTRKYDNGPIMLSFKTNHTVFSISTSNPRKLFLQFRKESKENLISESDCIISPSSGDTDFHIELQKFYPRCKIVLGKKVKTAVKGKRVRVLHTKQSIFVLSETNWLQIEYKAFYLFRKFSGKWETLRKTTYCRMIGSENYSML